MIRLEAMPHGVFWAWVGNGVVDGVIAVRCDPWEAMRVATKKVREWRFTNRRRDKRKWSESGNRWDRKTAHYTRNRYAYLDRTDEEIGHIAHIEEIVNA